MKRFLPVLLIVTMLLSMGLTGLAGDTEVGTPRAETLIVEMQEPTDTPGQFNGYMQGTSMGAGIHQLMSAMMWEMDTVSGLQFGEVADGFPEQNADFTEHIVKIRQGIKWSDGVDLTAKDVAFTFNMVMTNDKIGQNAYANTVFASVEAIDDYTVKFVTKEPLPRLSMRFGVTIWGNNYRVVPEHIYGAIEDVTTFKDENPVVAGPYTVKSYDPNGRWILYERREDWQNSTTGVVTGKMPAAKYVLFKALGEGDANIAEVMDALQAHGYAGWLVLEQDTAITGDEPTVAGGPIRDARQSIAFLHQTARMTEEINR